MKKITKGRSDDGLLARCRERGLRLTPQRLAVYEELCRSEDHPTAERLHSKVRKRLPGISLDTVNRTLMSFSEIGLAGVVEGEGRPRRFDPDTDSHHHVHCVRCGDIADFRSPEYDGLEIPPPIRRRFRVLGKKVVISGICPRCLKKEARRRGENQ